MLVEESWAKGRTHPSGFLFLFLISPSLCFVTASSRIRPKPSRIRVKAKIDENEVKGGPQLSGIFWYWDLVPRWVHGERLIFFLYVSKSWWKCLLAGFSSFPHSAMFEFGVVTSAVGCCLDACGPSFQVSADFAFSFAWWMGSDWQYLECFQDSSRESHKSATSIL